MRGRPGRSRHTPRFTVVLRGYDRREVDRFIERISPDGLDGRQMPAPDDLRSPRFTIVLRGYDCAEVDAYVRDVLGRS